jgi:hypothetical protein
MFFKSFRWNIWCKSFGWNSCCTDLTSKSIQLIYAIYNSGATIYIIFIYWIIYISFLFLVLDMYSFN